VDSTWTLEQLVERVEADLRDLDLAQASGRVSETPDARTVRYYGTLGILDRPVGTRSRRKLYGERHRQQLIAIKRLQARGLALDTIQATMLSMSPSELADLAGAARSAPLPEAASAAGHDRGRPFWKVTPAPALPIAPTSPAGPSDAPRPLAGLQVGPLTLTFAAAAAPSPDDLAALARLAAPLLAELGARGLLAPSTLTEAPR
jgi:DNA-binding transcriptional MerR regulator